MELFSISTHRAYLNTDITIEWLYGIPENDSYCIKYEYCDTEKTYAHKPISHIGGNILFLSPHKKETIKLKHAGLFKFTANFDGVKQEEVVLVEDAIKFGGSRIKDAFVFDDNPWVFVTTKDRLYATNIDTGEEKVEHNVTPDTIVSLGRYYNNPCEFFLFKTNKDNSIFNIKTGRLVITFSNHIYSNNHLVIYKSEDTVIIYDYRLEKTVLEFDDQFSFGSKFYYIKEGKLHGFNLSSSYINTIDFVGEIKNNCYLYDNYLVKLETDYTQQKIYKFYSLGNGEKNMKETSFVFPYYIESWKGYCFDIFDSAKSELEKFMGIDKSSKDLQNVKHIVLGIKVVCLNFYCEESKYYVKLIGEVISYPQIKISIPFTLVCEEGGTAYFKDCVVGQTNNVIIEQSKKTATCESSFSISKEESILGKSVSGKFIVSQLKGNLFYWDLEKGKKREILKETFDNSNYNRAYFTSDGKNVVFVNKDNSMGIMGLEEMIQRPFYVEGSTIARSAGFNGYNPEIIIIDDLNGRKPVWRDSISLRRISESEMSNHVFMSPDGAYIANIQKRTVYFNLLTKKEIEYKEYMELCKKYDWNSFTSDEDKKAIIALRRQLHNEYGDSALFRHIYEYNQKLLDSFPPKDNGSQKYNSKLEKLNKDAEKEYLEVKDKFTSLFVDALDYVIYKRKGEEKEKRILIGRNTWYLNYVSFSYDSHYLAFGAKMKEDTWRFSEEGVFEVYDLKEEKTIVREGNENNLYAVWMTMFNKNGDVAYYDSHANAMIAYAESDYRFISKAKGKSLLCFSPSGKYVALSDQNYIDYSHHPNSNWGHQPSGNIFIYKTEDLNQCLEQYNDFGGGINGASQATRRAGSVASAAFSSDEKRLLAVGEDGVIVIRNLITPQIEEIIDLSVLKGGSEKQHYYRKSERNGTILMTCNDYEGVKNEVVDFWCEPDETLDTEQSLIYSEDRTVLKFCMNIYNEEYYIPNGVKNILAGSFSGRWGYEGDYNALRILHLPDSIENVEETFEQCPSLERIYVSKDSENRIKKMLPHLSDLIFSS